MSEKPLWSWWVKFAENRFGATIGGHTVGPYPSWREAMDALRVEVETKIREGYVVIEAKITDDRLAPLLYDRRYEQDAAGDE